MKLIKPSFEIIEQQSGLDGLYKQIELAGRTCYKSEDKITPTSAKEFVDRMIKSGHGAMLEHGTIYLFCPTEEYVDSNGDVQYYNPLERYQDNSYSALAESNEGMYVTTNLRVLVEGNYMNDLKYQCEPTEFHERRVCVRFICDRGVSHEFVRHRVFSFAQESSRYCNYSKDKFGKELTYIYPCWMPEFDENDWSPFHHVLYQAERDYFQLLAEGWKPQQARVVLPNALKTELVMTGFVSDWKHFFELRCDSSAHPQARELAVPLKEEFIKRGIIDF